MNKNLITVAVTTVVLAGCSSTGPGIKAVEGQVEANASYVADSAGNAVLSGSSDCVMNGSFKSDMTVLGCDPAAAEKAAMEAAAAEKAAAEKAAMEAEAAKKAAAEKAAMEAAAAEKAAAEKAAAMAAAAQPVVMNLSGKALFASGSTQLSNEGQMAVQKLTEQLKAYSSISSLTIIGHTDSSGSDDMNQLLSEKRAGAVRDAILNSGVAADAQLSVMGMGESQPVASNETAEGRQQNRRVEVEVRGVQ